MPRISWFITLVALVVVSHQVINLRSWAVGAEPVSRQPAPEQDLAPRSKPKYPNGYIEEGPLPEGYPPPSEIGRIVEKTYPLTRTYSAEGNNAFMRCFAYLNKQKHEMTAPVIMDYKHRNSAEADPSRDLEAMDVERLHFILERPALDEPKRDGAVVVADLPTMRVLSVAVQGQLSDEVLQESEKMLAAEIKKRENIKPVGPYRVLGYNSPFVPKDKTYWEVQVPIATTTARPPDSRH